MEKYRNEDGTCRYCGSLPSQEHASTCELGKVTRQHDKITGEVFAETINQLRQWDIQDHPMGTSTAFAVQRDLVRQRTDNHAKEGRLTWADILDEEYYETLAEIDPVAMEEEAIQTAAVLVSMVAASRRARA